jgi:hypothetical protein
MLDGKPSVPPRIPVVLDLLKDPKKQKQKQHKTTYSHRNIPQVVDFPLREWIPSANPSGMDIQSIWY